MLTGMRLRYDEIEDLVALLTECAASAQEESLWLAHALAQASLGDNHLWQDLLLPHRGELNRLLRHWFPAIVARNSGDMKWKKFFYRQLCQEAEVLICKSPSCGVCEDYARCFEAPDEHSPAAATIGPPLTSPSSPAASGG